MPNEPEQPEENDTCSDRKGPRYDIPNKKVEALLSKGISVCEAARRLGCSQILVSMVRDGKRKNPKPAPKFPGKKMCCSCRHRPVKKGNRFLCDYCFRSGSVGDVYYDAVSHVSF